MNIYIYIPTNHNQNRSLHWHAYHSGVLCILLLLNLLDLPQKHTVLLVHMKKY